jgi:phosphoserine aminotransferase
LDWPTAAKSNSLYNTLPIFDVWIAGQVMSSLVHTYGAKRIAGQEEVSNQKAKLLYDTLDRHPHIYRVVPDKLARSRMNICFRVYGGDADKEKTFLSGAEKRGLTGLKGHRSVGGIRASNCMYQIFYYLGSKLIFSHRQRGFNGGSSEACTIFGRIRPRVITALPVTTMSSVVDTAFARNFSALALMIWFQPL